MRIPHVILHAQITVSKDFDLLIGGKRAGCRVVCTDSCALLPGLLADEKVALRPGGTHHESYRIAIVCPKMGTPIPLLHQ